MLKNGEVNPLNLWNMRQVEGTCPPHFERVEFDLYMHQTPKEYSEAISNLMKEEFRNKIGDDGIRFLDVESAKFIQKIRYKLNELPQ